VAELKIQFLDVGQGDGIFIEFPGGATMLVDLGSTKNKGLVSPDILAYFSTNTKFRTPGRTLDYLILTHGDRDHYNMVKEFIKDRQVKVARLLFGGLEGDYGNQLIAEIKKLCPDCIILQPTDDFPIPLPDPGSTFGGAQAYVLVVNARATSNSAEGWRKNTNSVVLMLVYQGAKVILAGDATTDTEKTIFGLLMQKLQDPAKVLAFLNSHVLKLGHHGSRRTSNSVAWIQCIQPRFVFISADRSGSLDDTTATGHRLPQTLTLSLIEKHSTPLYKNCVAHNMVSAFDTTDYTAYNGKPDVPGDNIPTPNVPPPGTTAAWWELSTQVGIFTSLVALDRSDPNASVFDQGAQYQLSISDAGVLEVTSTYTPGVVVKPVSVTNL
jgi:beta-lactamase superfamily II metal-dependent hydrolase